MLSTLRDYSSYFLWFVVVTFVGFMAFSGVQECGAGPAQRGILAEVNGQPLTLQAYSVAVSRATQNRQQQSQRELTEEQIAGLREQTWQQLVGLILLEQEATRRGISVSDQELASFLQQYPPEEVQQSPAFQNDSGVFDYNRYVRAMSNTSPEYTQFWRGLEQYWRPQLRQSKLQQQVISTVRVSDAELQEYYRRSKDQARVEFLMVNSNVYNDSVGTATDEELRAIYEDETSRYRRQERVVMQMAAWSRQASPADTAFAKQQIADVKQQLESGADFIETAEIYTMDPSGQGTGGDLGWFGKGSMVKPFEDAVYALEVGEISDPVETRFGWHIIKLEETRTSEKDSNEREVRARHILIRPEISQETIDAIYQRAQDYSVAVREGQIEFTRETAEGAGAAWFNPGPVQRGDNLPFLGTSPDVKSWLFSAEIGAVSDPIDEGGKFVVAHLMEKRDAGLASLEEVRAQVETRFISRRTRELARVQADSLWRAALAGESLRELAKAENVTLTTTGLFSPTTNVANVARSPIFMGTVFSLSEENAYSDLVPVENGWVMIHVLEMQLADLNQLEAVRDSVASELLQTKQSNAFTRWVTDLYENADIKDYRSEIFGTTM